MPEDPQLQAVKASGRIQIVDEFYQNRVIRTGCPLIRYSGFLAMSYSSLRKLVVAGVFTCLCICPKMLVGQTTESVPNQATSRTDISPARLERPGLFSVDSMKFDWKDDKRVRNVPVKIYFPKTGKQLPMIVFSHGLGGTRDGYSYLGEHWASHGYVVIHVQHVGSDDSVWRGSKQPLVDMRRAASDPQNSLNRPIDVRYVLDQMERFQEQDSPFRNRLDLNRIAVAGHSFGAYTALAVSGQIFAGPLGRESRLSDPRIRAAVIMSAPVNSRQDADKSYGKLSLPVLIMTGTKDTSPINDTTAEQRRIPFDHAPVGDKFLVIFQDGNHKVFSGPTARFITSPQDKLFHSLILSSTTAFWNAYLGNDKESLNWLRNGGFAGKLGQSGTFEMK